METFILAIETATSACSTSLLKDGVVLGEQTRRTPRMHNKALPEMVDAVLEVVDCERSRIGVVAISIGPGSFTGLRVGLSFAKGFALAVGATVIPVGTLDGMTLGIHDHLREKAAEAVDQMAFCPLTVARRGEVFGQIFRSEAGVLKPATEIFLGDAALVAGRLSPGMVVAGEGADMILSELREQLDGKLFDLQDEGNSPEIHRGCFYLPDFTARASTIGRLAWRRWLTDSTSIPPVERLEPLYLKEFTVHKRKP